MLEVIEQLDTSILLWIETLARNPILDSFFLRFTALGNAGLVWIVVSLLMLCWTRTRKIGFWALVSMALGLLVTNVTIKPLVARTRPWVAIENLGNLVESSDPNSFPSGHTCAAFAAGVSWMIHSNKTWVKTVCLGQAVLMGYSRLHVGVHYPTDVLVGAAIGSGCGWLAWKIETRKNSL